jgi:hypothetical protein
MSGATYSFVFDRKSALEIFKDVGDREIVLAVLAGLAPEAGWEGCRVYAGAPPDEHAGQYCIGISGPGADTVQLRLVEGLEKVGIVILAVYEGGPEPLRTIGTASGGKWTTSTD